MKIKLFLDPHATSTKHKHKRYLVTGQVRSLLYDIYMAMDFFRDLFGYMGVSSSLIWICGGCVDMWRFLFGYMVARPRGYLDLWWSAGRLTFRCVVVFGFMVVFGFDVWWYSSDVLDMWW